MSIIENKEPKFLKEPLSINDLLKDGSCFEIHSNFEDSNEAFFDETIIGSDDEQEMPLIDEKKLVSPWTKSFAELREQMQKINEHLHKKVMREGDLKAAQVGTNARVCMRYNAYWEYEGSPFDSTFVSGTPCVFQTGEQKVISGLDMAAQTMRVGEQAMFIISHKVLWGELGCPPRVKPKSDGLFIIDVVSSNDVGSECPDLKVHSDEQHQFRTTIDKIKQVHIRGLDFFRRGCFRNACRCFERAVDLLSYCIVANKAEENEQTTLLLKLYTNLAVSYLKTKQPGKTCIICKEIRRLSSDKPGCKALFQEGRALLMLGEYERARTVLLQAQQIEPQNLEISKEIRTLESRFKKYKETEQSIWRRAMGYKADSKSAIAEVQGENKFETEIIGLMKSFKENLTLESFKLPPCLTDEEIGSVASLARRMELELSISTLDKPVYTLTKKS